MLFSVSVDLDSVRLYRAAHGLSPRGGSDPVFEVAVPRLTEWAAARKLPLTWYVVGCDLGLEANAETVRRLARRGHEVGSHSFSHHYDLTRRPIDEIRWEVQLGIAAVHDVTGNRVAGFRAPGYVVTNALLDLLREQGLEYDASVFPCPSYYLAKAAAIAGIAGAGRESHAIIGAPGVLRAPTVPYRVGSPYWLNGSGILEIPVQVVGKLRLPFIGTALGALGPGAARRVTRMLRGKRLVNLELHGIDVLDQGDCVDELAKHQPDLRIPWRRKLAAIDAAVTFLRGEGYSLVRMQELAECARLSP